MLICHFELLRLIVFAKLLTVKGNHNLLADCYVYLRSREAFRSVCGRLPNRGLQDPHVFTEIDLSKCLSKYHT